jgi:FPC/CPF motif-containing protein YcgG
MSSPATATPVANPFASDAGGFYKPANRGVDRLAGGDDRALDLRAAATHGALQALIGDSQYPCVGAKSAFNNGSYRLGLYGTLGSHDATRGLARDLFDFRHRLDSIDGRFATFVSVFDGPLELSEAEFERRLWQQLQALHFEDAPLHDWDSDVSSDPDDPHFSFSFAGRAFFIVGLHPRASRIARRFPWPTIVFNAHDQFERLREEGKMERMKTIIRQKDLELQGTENPVLRDHGDESEARQYSGRAVEDDWQPPFVSVSENQPASKCPFHRLFGRNHKKASRS